jgi:hypothetical protein
MWSRITSRTGLALIPLALAGLAAAPAHADGPTQLTLPAPTGPNGVGVVSLHLTDPSRADPWSSPGQHREFMADVWYPAARTAGYPRKPWTTPGAGAAMLEAEHIPADKVRLPVSHGYYGAPVAGRKLPVVVYSPGNNGTRSDNTVVVEELASRGYVVVAMDHTYDGITEFPDGRVVTPVPDGPAGAVLNTLRTGDARFVLDQLPVLNSGGNPDTGHRPLPPGLRGAFDLGRIAMFGASAGGRTTASVMYEDGRVRAGLSLDGPVDGPVIQAGLDRPFMLIGARSDRAHDPDLAEFWSHLRGWRLNVRAKGAEHVSYSDYETLIPQLAPVLGWSPEQVKEEIGELDPDRGIVIQRAYALAFFDKHLRGRGHLLDGPSPCFPEVTAIP